MPTGKKVKTVMLEDGEDLFVMVRTKRPDAWDPATLYGSVMRMYRVIGIKSSTPMLELIPIMDAGVATAHDTDREEKKIALDK
jgi:hypothetical protein